MEERIEKILDLYIRPQLKEHGGDVEVSRIVDGTVYVRMRGSCSTCIFAQSDIQGQMKEELTKRVPGVEDVSLDTMDPDLFNIAKKILNHELTPS